MKTALDADMTLNKTINCIYPGKATSIEHLAFSLNGLVSQAGFRCQDLALVIE